MKALVLQVPSELIAVLALRFFFILIAAGMPMMLLVVLTTLASFDRVGVFASKERIKDIIV